MVVKAQQKTKVVVTQLAVDSSFYQTWWFWTLAVATVAGTAVGVAVATRGGGDGGGETGVSVTANAGNAFQGRP